MASDSFRQGHENIDLLGNRLTVDQRTLTPPVKTYGINLLAFPKLSNGQSNINGLAGILSNRLPVECGNCGWTGKRKPGNIVQCPKCGSFAAFQPLPHPIERKP